MRQTFRFMCTLLILLGTARLQADDKLVIAHRGASGYLPEHTLAAKVLAFAQGADYLEQDVVMTRDDQLIVFHDLTLERMTNVASVYAQRARADGRYYVIDFTLAELKQLTVHEGSRTIAGTELAVFPARFPLESALFSIHTLAEELELIAGLQASTGKKVGIYPELKSPWFHHQHGKDLSRAVLQVLREYGYTTREDAIYLQSFDYPELQRLKLELLPELGMDLKLVQLIARNEWVETMALDADQVWQAYDFEWMLTSVGIRQLATLVDGLGPAWDMLLDARSVPALGAQFTSSFVQTAHEVGLQVHPYTFRREPEQLPSWAGFENLLDIFLYQLGVDGVFTDFPDLVRDFVDQHQ